MRKINKVLLVFLVLLPTLLSAQEDCTWSISEPTKMTGNCNIEAIATLSLRPRSNPSHTVKITNLGRSDGGYTVYESDGCSDKNRYSFCRGNGWSITATPIKLDDSRIGLLTASHFKRTVNSKTIFRDVAIFLPGHYHLGGKLTKLDPIPISKNTTDGKTVTMLADVRRNKENIPLQISLKATCGTSDNGTESCVAITPKKMGKSFGGISGTSLLNSGSIQAVFGGFLEGPEPFDLLFMTPASKIRELIERANKAGPHEPFVILD